MKKKGHQKIVFKPYNMNQLSLPMSLESIIPPHHKVRTVNEVIEEMGVDPFLAKYKGGGAAVRENIHFMWLAGGNTPDFRTLNRFRAEMKEIIDEVFQQLMEYLLAKGLVKLENYFLDGTKIEANANKYSFVWKKSTEKNREKLRQKVKGLLEEIDRANELEDKLYGDEDLSEMGENVVDDPEAF